MGYDSKMKNDNMNDPEYRREHARHAVSLEAKILEGVKWHDCQIINISASGAKVLITKPVPIGDMVMLEIGSFGRFSGNIVWQNSKELGLKFTQDPDLINDLIIGIAMYG